MAEDTIDFLKDCGLSVRRNNPRQYSAVIADMEPQIEVWFQRATDIVRKVMDGDVDFGLVGYDLVAEESNGSPDIVVVHDALGFGHCRLSVAVPTSWQDVHSMDDLVRFAKSRPESSPLRAVSKYHNMTRKFFESCGMRPYKLLYGDGALEANPPMGSADFIVDLVSTGVTLRENQLKEIEGGTMLNSQSVLIANRTALASRPDALAAVHEMLERFEAHLYAKQKYEVTANMRGESELDVGSQLLSQPDLGGLSGPTVSRIILKDGTETEKWFSVSVVVRKDRLYESMREMRRIGGRGILVKPITYIFEDDPPRWSALLDTLAASS